MQPVCANIYSYYILQNVKFLNYSQQSIKIKDRAQFSCRLMNVLPHDNLELFRGVDPVNGDKSLFKQNDNVFSHQTVFIEILNLVKDKSSKDRINDAFHENKVTLIHHTLKIRLSAVFGKLNSDIVTNLSLSFILLSQ